METKQKTINKPVTISGVGLHTGKQVNMTFMPAPEFHGYKFQRTDLPDQPIIEADVDLVIDTARGTTLGKNGVTVNTVEHTLAACAGLSIDNLLIQIDGPEPPIMDGSAEFFVKALLDAGIKEQEAEREYFELINNIYHSNPELNQEMVAMPLDGFRATVLIDYNSPILGSQHASLLDINEFKNEIASSRTFCLLNEIEELYKRNLIKGGDFNNAIVIVDREVGQDELLRLAKMFNKNPDEIKIENGGILNNVTLRHNNEPARHKLLDLIGDLSLVGMPLKAQIMAARPGHTVNIEFARKIKRYIKTNKQQQKLKVPVYDPNHRPLFYAHEIEKIMPHRHPFLLVDKVIEMTDKYIVGIKNVTYGESFFPGHFPGNPIFPGVLQIEAMAQLGGVMILGNKPDPQSYSTYFVKIDKTRFKEKVRPGDTLILIMELISPIKRGICMMSGKAFVGNKLVVEAELMAQIVKNQ